MKPRRMQRLIPIALAMLATAPFVHAGPAGPTDPQIASIVVAANQVDIDAGRLAATKAQSPEVKSLAQRMVTDHSTVNDQARALVTKLKVEPQSHPTGEALTRDGAATLAKLRTLQGAAFDTAYVANEVKYHETVIEALDKTLIPGATNPELRALLVKVRPAFLGHLEHARYLQSKLGGPASP
jgi:putative membrane protein